MGVGSTMKTAGVPVTRFTAAAPIEGSVPILSLQEASSGIVASKNRQRLRDPTSDREPIILMGLRGDRRRASCNVALQVRGKDEITLYAQAVNSVDALWDVSGESDRMRSERMTLPSHF